MELNRGEFVQRLVLECICDDYENVDQIILPSVAKEGARCGLTIERVEVVDALAKLIQQGLAKAYLLSKDALELDGMPPVDVVEKYFKTYFLATPKGIDFHRADDTWWTERHALRDAELE